MKIVYINTTGGYGSTGKIVESLASEWKRRGGEAYSFCGIGIENALHSKFGYSLSAVESAIFGNDGMCSGVATRKLIKKLETIKPDIIHLHNLHGHYIDSEILFDHIKANRIKTVWTLHDCWSFTGHCAHFDMKGCDKWKTGCSDCPQYKSYPRSLFDTSEKMWNKKKDTFCGVDDLTFVAPSCWIAGLLKDSFLKEYPVQIIRNGIDQSIFKPCNEDVFADLHSEGKTVVLGVASEWGRKKGLDVFIKLAKTLPDNFAVVLVGTTEKTESYLPSNVVAVRKTANASELAKIYSSADVFVNPTREDTYPTVNMESISCGTPAITFATGGSPESISALSGVVVPKNDTEKLTEEILKFSSEEYKNGFSCAKQSKNFCNVAFVDSYMELYNRILGI